MRKLTVKNFSVIKEAELEFGKITVLIGPQSSGKSLLCKLAFFFGREMIKISVDMAVHRLPFAEFKSAVEREFTKWFPRGGWGADCWTIRYTEDEYDVAVSCAADNDLPPKAVFSPAPSFEASYNAQLKETDASMREKGFLLAPAIQSRAATRFFKIAGRGVWDTSIYIPTQRSYFVDTKKGYRALAAEADPISAQFADAFANGLKPTGPDSRVLGFLGGMIVSILNDWMMAFEDGRHLSLSKLSSGSKETLPILTTLDYYEEQRRPGNLVEEELYGERLYYHDDFTIEEPEASVFPRTQYELVKEFVELSNEATFVAHFTITTHSPYILTAFNTLIEAWRVGSKDGKREQVASLVPEKYWVNESDFAPYAIHDGVLVPIFEKEQEGKEGSGLIDGDYLDSVSDQLGGEFEKLLDIEYAN
jgi:hypothetical protein